ncbi:MAG: hypothetical protein HYR56_00400 [Acidobacteria bacterium]|nr:hypothetical protein [Acidobacteriota bacterium]MBI3422349.1 hypothetical protein [Acidobacteriota bacterium]
MADPQHGGPLRLELQPRDFPQAFATVVKQVAIALGSASEPAESAAQTLVEQFLLLRFLEVKGWLGEPDFMRQQCQWHWQAAPEAPSFFIEVIAPRLRVLSNTGLLYNPATPTALPALPNRVCKIICDTLFGPFRYTIHEVTAQEAEKVLDPEWLGAMSEQALLERPLKQAQSATTQRRIRGSFQTPRRVMRWMCREALLQYLTGKLAEFTHLSPAALREQLLFFFNLPPAPRMTDDHVAELSEHILRAEAQRMSRALLACRICDPAVGIGTLLAGMLEELAAALAKLDLLLYGRGLIGQHNYEFRLKRKLLSDCLYGVDVQPPAIALCRQRLWLMLVACEQSAPDAALAVTIREAANTPALFQHLVCGDSLLGCRTYDDGETDAFKWRRAFPHLFQQRGGFDILIGNPPIRPFLAKDEAEKDVWAQIGTLFPQVKRSKNTAAAFFDLPRLIGAAGVITCQIVPRSLTYSEGWAATRALLRLNYHLLSAADVSEAYQEAQLEQEVLFYRRDPDRDELVGEAAPEPVLLSTALTSANVVAVQTDARTEIEERYELSGGEMVRREIAIPVAAVVLSAPARELQERLARLRTLGEFVTVKRGQRWQRRTKPAGRASAAVPVIKGTNLRQFRITDELPRQEPPAYIQRVLEELRQPKLVCPNTLAHLKKPHEMLVLLCALDRSGSVALDTVQQLFPAQDCPYSLELLCGLLNSSLARWFFYYVTYQQAARAVAFDAAQIGSLPLPRANHRLISQVEKQVRKLLKLELPRKYFLRGQLPEYDALDELICELYELSEEERREVLR